MERHQQLFKILNDKSQGAFVPFITLGDPNEEMSLKIIDTLIEAKADALEIGIPFSDLIADAPTIQKTNLRALKANIAPTHCFELLSQIRKMQPLIPIGLLVYANLVFGNGIDSFYAQCQNAGIDSVLIAHVPMNESQPFRTSALRYHVLPPLLGFGISEQKQVSDVIKNGIVEAISDSTVVKLIEIYHQKPDILLAKLKQFVSQMKMATQK
ncbi:MAG: tryptophan synthase subunit alpha [Candidatus Phlomobacter fragariae]